MTRGLCLSLRGWDYFEFLVGKTSWIETPEWLSNKSDREMSWNTQNKTAALKETAFTTPSSLYQKGLSELDRIKIPARIHDSAALYVILK